MNLFSLFSRPKPMSIRAAGVVYYEDNLVSVGRHSKAFDLPDKAFANRYANGKRIYEYYFQDCVGALIPEPTNPHDKNAIKVTLDGLTVGYVPSTDCKAVKRCLSRRMIPRISAKGGRSKSVINGEVHLWENGYIVYIDIDYPLIP